MPFRLSAVERREDRGRFFKPVRQVIESVNDIFKGQLDLERHDGHTPAGVTVQILQRILALPPPSGTTTPPASPSCAHYGLQP
jgi:hypothetical protein